MTQVAGLNERQIKFIEHYLVSGNAKESYIKAGFSPNSASQGASLLLQRPIVKAAIDANRANIKQEAQKEVRLTYAFKLNILYDGIVHYAEGKEYDKASKLIEVANKMQGHNMPEKPETKVIDAEDGAIAEVEKRLEMITIKHEKEY